MTKARTPQQRAKRAEQSRRRYVNNRVTQRARTRENNERLVENREQDLINLLKSTPCMDCGEDDFMVLNLFRRNRFDPPSFRIRLPGFRSNPGREKFDAAVAKCDVLCANCEQRRLWAEHMEHTKRTPNGTAAVPAEMINRV